MRAATLRRSGLQQPINQDGCPEVRLGLAEGALRPHWPAHCVPKAVVIERVVRYLSDAGVAFRLAVYPMPEALPHIAYPLGSDLLAVDARVVLVDGSPAIACARACIPMTLSRLQTVLRATVREASSAELRDEFRGAPEPVPPLGGLFGVPLFVDDGVAAAARIVFHAFSAGSYVELAYEDFARIERPRVVLFAQAGLLPPERT